MKSKIIIILSNEFDVNYNINQTTRQRADYANNIYNLGDIIITLGWNGGYPVKPISCKVKDYLINKFKICEKFITSLSSSKDTVGDAFFSREYLEKSKMIKNEIHVVTSCWHMNRVRYIFNKIYHNSNITYHEVQTPELRSNTEIQSLELFKKNFKNLESIELEFVRKKLFDVHPLYSDLY